MAEHSRRKTSLQRGCRTNIPFLTNEGPVLAQEAKHDRQKGAMGLLRHLRNAYTQIRRAIGTNERVSAAHVHVGTLRVAFNRVVAFVLMLKAAVGSAAVSSSGVLYVS